MNSKFKHWWWLISVGLLFPLQAGAVSEIEQQTPGNPNNDLLVTSEKTANGVHFVVKMASLATGLVGADYDFSGRLIVVGDDGQEIASCKIEKSPDGKSVSFEFEVAAKYLEKSEFNFVSSPRGHPAFVRLWFYLKDFAPPK